MFTTLFISTKVHQRREDETIECVHETTGVSVQTIEIIIQKRNTASNSEEKVLVKRTMYQITIVPDRIV